MKRTDYQTLSSTSSSEELSTSSSDITENDEITVQLASRPLVPQTFTLLQQAYDNENLGEVFIELFFENAEDLIEPGFPDEAPLDLVKRQTPPNQRFIFTKMQAYYRDIQTALQTQAPPAFYCALRLEILDIYNEYFGRTVILPENVKVATQINSVFDTMEIDVSEDLADLLTELIFYNDSPNPFNQAYAHLKTQDQVPSKIRENFRHFTPQEKLKAADAISKSFYHYMGFFYAHGPLTQEEQRSSRLAYWTCLEKYIPQLYASHPQFLHSRLWEAYNHGSDDLHITLDSLLFSPYGIRKEAHAHKHACRKQHVLMALDKLLPAMERDIHHCITALTNGQELHFMHAAVINYAVRGLYQSYAKTTDIRAIYAHIEPDVTIDEPERIVATAENTRKNALIEIPDTMQVDAATPSKPKKSVHFLENEDTTEALQAIYPTLWHRASYKTFTSEEAPEETKKAESQQGFAIIYAQPNSKKIHNHFMLINREESVATFCQRIQAENAARANQPKEK